MPAPIALSTLTPETKRVPNPPEGQPVISTKADLRDGSRPTSGGGGGGGPVGDTTLSSLPLAAQSDLTGNFLGAFKLQSHNGTSDNGDSVSFSYGGGIIAADTASSTLIAAGTRGGFDTYRGDPLAGLSIPALVDPVTPHNAAELNETTKTIDWASMLLKPTVYANDEPTAYMGLYLENGKLYYTAARDYDTDPFSGNHLAVASNSGDLRNSTIEGWYRFGTENDQFYVGSITRIPAELQSEFNGDTHMLAAGGGAKISINSRLSMGPSLATFKLSDIDALGQTGEIPINKLLEYPLGNELWAKRTGGQYNATPETQASAAKNEPTAYGEVTPSDNNLWTQLSQAFAGFIVPGTRTMAFVGRSAGHVGGAAYKAIQSNGRQAAGPAACEWEDYVNYYWLYDLSAIKSASSLSELEPYEYGLLTHADNWIQHVNDGDNYGLCRNVYFDSEANRMYLCLEERTSQSDNAKPVILVYQVGSA